MWTPNARNYFFNANHNEDQADQLFIDRYGSSTTHEHMDANLVGPRNLRKILNRLSEITPDLDQTTPRWTRPNPDRLMVLFGRSNVRTQRGRLSTITRKPRFGVYGYAGRIYLWMDRGFLFNPALIPNYPGYALADWPIGQYGQTRMTVSSILFIPCWMMPVDGILQPR